MSVELLMVVDLNDIVLRHHAILHLNVYVRVDELAVREVERVYLSLGLVRVALLT